MRTFTVTFHRTTSYALLYAIRSSQVIASNLVNQCQISVITDG